MIIIYKYTYYSILNHKSEKQIGCGISATPNFELLLFNCHYSGLTSLFIIG